MKCIIVDDDSTSRILISDLVERREDLELVACCSDGVEAEKMLENNQIDLVLLDIEMPGMTGLELAQSMKKNLVVIFITAKEEYAVKAFEAQALDYLVKPIVEDRFSQAVERASARVRLLNGNDKDNEFLFVKSGTAYNKLKISEIEWVESIGDYIGIHLGGKRFVVHTTLKDAEKRLAQFNFCRVHRCHIVNFDKVGRFEENNISIGEQWLPVSRTYKKNVLERMNVL